MLELMFQEYELTGQERVCERTYTGEQTADVIVPDTYPDVDRIIDAFGTMLVQDVRIHPDGVSFEGKVQGGVLFLGEKGEIHSLPINISLSGRKELPAEGDNGILCYRCELRSVDARAVNSRKLLVRIGFQWSVELYKPFNRKIRYLDEPTERIQLRQREYPMRLPTAWGEKRFTVNEELELPGNCPPVGEMLKLCSRLQIMEQKAVGGKGVFKMELLLHLLYEDPQGKLCTYDWRIPVSQYGDLTSETQDGELHTLLHLTELELEPDSHLESHRLFLRAGIHGQLMAYEMRNVRIIEDAFCTDAILEPQWQQWQWRPLLDSKIMSATARKAGMENIGTPVDLWVSSEEWETERKGDSTLIKIPLCCSVLSYDGEGNLRGNQHRIMAEAELPLSQECECCIRDIQCTEVYCSAASGSVEIRVPVQLTADCFGTQGFRSLNGGELLPLSETGERSPSVILRRTEGEEELWDIAKSYRTPVEGICRANDLEEGVVPEGTMLLIPL